MTIDVSSQVTTSQFIPGEEMNSADFTTPFGQIVTILNNLANGAQDVEAIRLAELGADPATPPTGKWKIYTKPEGLFVMDDTGAVTGPLGTGGGGGASDAAEVTFTPAILANWDGSADPGDVNDALDQLAARLVAHTHDDRYYTESESDSLLSGKADTAHTHVHTDITDFDAEVNALISAAGSGPHDHNDLYYTEAEVDTFLSGKSNVGHTHAATDITSGTLAQGRGGFGVDTTHVSFGPGRFGQLSAGGTPTSIKENYAATVAPSATDDENSGYRVGSLWFDTTADKAYLCVDATASSAVWIEAGGSGGAAKARDYYIFDEATDYTTTAVSFTNIDATKVKLDMTTGGGDILVGFNGNFQVSGTGTATVYINMTLDGVSVGDDDGMHFAYVGSGAPTTANFQSIGFTRLIPSVAAGVHVIVLQWKVVGTTGIKLLCANGTNLAMRPQFWGLEV